MCPDFAAVYGSQTVLCRMEKYADIFTGKMADSLWGHLFILYSHMRGVLGNRPPMGGPHEGLSLMITLSGQLSA